MQSAIFVCTSRLQFIWLSASLSLYPSRCLCRLDIFPLISVAIQLNLACLIYLINFFLPATLQNCHSLFSLFYLHFLLSFSLSSSLLSPSFCLKKFSVPTWPQSFRDFHLSSSRRQSAPFFAILIVYKWLTLFFIVCRTHRQRGKESERVRGRQSGCYCELLLAEEVAY